MFFTQINGLMNQSIDITMVIRKSGNGMTVSVLPKSNGLKDEAQNHIVPLTLTGLPGELDAGFMEAVAKPIQKVSGLLTNMAEFEKQADKAAANSKAVKDAKSKETKEEKEKREKYEKLMKKAGEYITAKNHKEAVATLGQAKAYATQQQLKEIEEKIKAETAEMDKGSLFGMMEDAPRPVAVPSAEKSATPPPVPATTRPHQEGAHAQPSYIPQQEQYRPVQQPAGQPVYYRQPQQPYRGQPGAYPPQGDYAQQPPQGQPPRAEYGNGMPPHYAGYPPMEADGRQYPPQNEPAYRPDEYAEYPDFPVGMLNPQYQTTNQAM